jgi:dienelactone hydrolase
MKSGGSRLQIRIALILLVLAAAMSASGQLPKITDAPPPTTEFTTTARPPSDPNVQEAILRFPSAVTTAIKENNTVEVELYTPRDAPKPMPVVIVLHYWGASDLQTEERLARKLNEKGIAAAILVLPYHMRRSPPGVRSGEAAITPDVSALIETMTQAVMDVKRLIDYITSNNEYDSKRIALSGVSLGGIVGALCTGVDSRISAAAFVLAGGDLAHLLFNSTVTMDVRRELRKKGYDEQRLRAALQPIEPLNFVRPEIGDSILIVGARYDQVVPPVDTQKLETAWNAKHRITLDTGHYGGVLVERRLYRSIADFFDSRFVHANAAPPRSFSTPTVRIGISYATDYGLTVGAGLDLLRTRSRDAHLTGFITPVGPLLYGAKEIGSGLSVGLLLGKHGPAVGLIWSIVL